MGNTPNLALPYPVLGDTADVPRDIKALADKLDALLGGGGSGGGGGTGVGTNLPVLDVGRVNQIRAGRQLSVADFTGLGLSVPVGLFNLGSLVNLGTGGPLVNLGAVPFGVGINGLAATAAVCAGSTGQALYIADTGANDPFRIKTGSWGCWHRTAKRATEQWGITKWKTGATAFGLGMSASSLPYALLGDGIGGVTVMNGISDIADDRWHHLVSTFDGTTWRLYVDAVLETVVTAVTAGAIGPAAAPLNVGALGADGATAATSPHYGRVDEAFVTADVLTDDQVRLLYAARLTHTLAAIPADARLSVHRRRKGAAYAVADFPAQPVRLHNFTGGALTDQGSGGVALVAVGGGTITDVAGADGTPLAAKSFSGAHAGLGATDAGLPGGLTTRSYGAWFKTTSLGAGGFIGWGTPSTGDVKIMTPGTGIIWSVNAADQIAGPYIADGQWHQAIVVEDNTAGDGVRRKLYLDGRLVGGSTVLTGVTLGGANRFRVGADINGSNPMTGQIDGAFVAGTALTMADVQALYSKGTQDLGASPKNAGDHIERLDATSVLFIGDTLESQHTIDLGVVA